MSSLNVLESRMTHFDQRKIIEMLFDPRTTSATNISRTTGRPMSPFITHETAV